MRFRPFGRIVMCAKVIFALLAGWLVVLEFRIHTDTYRGPNWFPLAVAIAVGLGTAFVALKGIRDAATVNRRWSAQAKIWKESIDLLFDVAAATEIRAKDIGVSVYKVRWRPRLRCPRLGRGTKPRDWSPLYYTGYLYPVSRWRSEGIPQPSTIRWTEHKGTQGECVHSKDTKHRNWAPIIERWKSNPEYNISSELPEQFFDTLTPQERANFRYDELKKVLPRYGEVLAAPIKVEREVLGALVVDRPYDKDLAEDRLNRAQVRIERAASAENIRESIKVAPRLD